MNRVAGVLVVCAFVLGVVGLSVPSVRTAAQGGDASPVAQGAAAGPVASPRVAPRKTRIAVGLPAGVAFDELVSGQIDDLPAAPAVLQLERLTFAPGAATGELETLGPEILHVETGEILVADEFGLESPLAAGDGVLLRPESGYEMTNDGAEDAVVLRLRVLSADDAEGSSPDEDDETSVASPVAPSGDVAEPDVETLLEGEIEDALPEPGVVFLARTTWEPVADTGEYTQTGPVGLLVESGTLTVTSPTGVEGQVREGRGVVLPAGVQLRARNAETEEASALMVGVLPAGGALIEPVVPTATPTIEPTATTAATSTLVPTPTVPPTPTSEPTSIPAPTPISTSEQGTILQMGETWEVVDASC